MAGFSDQVAKISADLMGYAEDVFKESVQDLVAAAQQEGPSKNNPAGNGGRMRVDTGFLRASFLMSTTAMPAIDPEAKPPEDAGPNSIPYNGEEISAVIANAEIGGILYGGWTASYAAIREFGREGEPPDAFMRTAAQRWPEIVARNEEKLRGLLAQS